MRRFALIGTAVAIAAGSSLLQPAQAAPLVIADPAGDAGLIVEEGVGIPAGAPATLDILETKIEHIGETLHFTTKMTEVADVPPPGTTGYIVAIGFTIGDAPMSAYAARDSIDGDQFILYYATPDQPGTVTELACGKCKGKFSTKDGTVSMEVPLAAIAAVKRFYPGTPEPGPGKAGFTEVSGYSKYQYNIPGVVKFFPTADQTEVKEFAF